MDDQTRQEVEALVSQLVEARMAALNAGGNAQRELAFAVPGNGAAPAAEAEGAQLDKPAWYSTDAAEQGKRRSDSWRWTCATGTNITVSNVHVAFNGVVKDWNYSAGLTIDPGGTYVYAIITWTREAESGLITGITSVALATTTQWTKATETVTDEGGSETGQNIPIGLFKSATGSWGNTIVCLRRYVEGALLLTSRGDDWTTDTNRETLEDFDQFSVEYVEAQGTDVSGHKYKRYVQLYNFEVGDDGTLLTAESAGWTDPVTGAAGEKVLVRKVVAAGQIRLQYKGLNPVPRGDATNVTLKWNDTLGGFTAALPVDATDDAQTGALATGDRVVTAVKTSPNDGNLLQLVTKPLGATGGLTAADFESIDVLVPGTAFSSSGGSTTIQFKKRTLLVLKTTAAAVDSDSLPFSSVEVLVPGTAWDVTGKQIRFQKQAVAVPGALEKTNSDTVGFAQFSD